MNRRSLINRIIDKLFRKNRNLSKQLVADISFVTPDYIKNITEKYGNQNWALTAEQFQSEWNKAQTKYFEEKVKPNNDDTICYEGVIKQLQSFEDKLKQNGNETKNT